MTPEVLGTGGDTAFLMVPLPSPKEGLQHPRLNTDLHACSQSIFAHSLGPGSCSKTTAGLSSSWPMTFWGVGSPFRMFYSASGASQTPLPEGAPLGKRRWPGSPPQDPAKALPFGGPSSHLMKLFASHIRCFLLPA